MNKIHNVIWCTARNAWVVVAEGTTSRSKSGSKTLKAMIALLLLSPAGAMAATLPQGGSITVGNGSIVNNGGNQLVIKQISDKLGINWQSFNVGPDGHVIFDQPGKNSIALNRVIGSDGSSILGKIDANGQVFLINPNGVIFGKGAEVNVGGLVASTLNITDEDFKNGNFKFKAGASNGQILNEGSLHSAEGGYIALLGKSVKNNGVIQAKLGTASLAAGSAVSLDFAGDGLINLQVDQGAVDALAENKGLIKADGGNVLMTARASNALTQTVVNNEGVIQAQTIGSRNGKIFLDGGMDNGTVLVAGTLDASAPSTGDGGFIETSGKTVKVVDGAKVTTKAAAGKTGKWLVDPTDFTIYWGADPATVSGIGTDTLISNLSSTNVELQTSSSGSERGNITVDGEITWAADTTLTLTAHGDINVKYNINANGANSGVALNYGNHGADTTAGINFADNKSINLNGANTSYAENGVNFIILRTVDDLLKLDNPANVWGRFALAGDIDASATSGWNGGLGYKPAAQSGSFFGTLNGLNHSVNNLYINRPTEDNVGLIGNSQISRISNIGINGSVTGRNNVGLLSGLTSNTTFDNVRSSGSVTGINNVGGVAGALTQGNVKRANSAATVNGANTVGGVLGKVSFQNLSYLFSTGNVFGQDNVGGLIGDLNQGSLTNAYAIGNTFGNSKVGGIAGHAYASNFKTTYSSGQVNGSGDGVGGLAGAFEFAAIQNSFSTSKVTGQNDVGGLVGRIDQSNLSNIYASGSVTGNNNVGGLLGNATQIAMLYSYSTGLVTGSGSKGGLIGGGSGLTVSESFWDTTKSGLFTSAAGVGHADLTDASIFSNWDIALDGGSSKTWRIYDGHTAPLLRAFMGTATFATINDATTEYIGRNLADGDVSFAYSYNTDDASFFVPKADMFISLTSNGNAIRNAGTYVLDGFYSSQFGFDVTEPVKAKLTVTKAHLNIDALAQDKIYDGNTNASLSFGDDRKGSDSLTISGTGAFADKNAGNGKTVNVSGITVGGADAINYTWDETSAVTADISTRKISVGATGSDKTYDGSTSATVNLTADGVAADPSNTGVVSGDNLLLSGAATFTDKNAGAGKTVTVNGVTLGGADASNYELYDPSAVIQTNATINKANLTVSASGNDKSYDGTTAAGVTLSDNRIGGDSLTISSGSSAFSDKNAGSGKTINVGGITVSGADAQNYNWNGAATTTANIDKAMLNVSAIGQNKVYDGSNGATVSLGDDRFGSDDLTISSGDATFADKNAGNGKVITVNGITVTGADAQNYDWSTTASTTADISKAVLNVSASGQDKAYDGSTSAGVSFSDDRIAGDDLTLSGSASFSDKNAGGGKVVNVNGITATGADAQNYSWSGLATTTATITKALLNVFANAQDRTYDGTNNAQVTLGDDRIAGDDLMASYSTSTFSDKNAGTGKTVTVGGITLSGADVDNYSFNTSATAQADIAKANLVVKADNASKVEGSADGQLHWNLQSGTVYAGDSIDGALARDAGEDTGLYAINQGDLTAGANYVLSVVPGVFEITQMVKPPVIVDPIEPPVVVEPPVVIEPPVEIDPPTPPVVVPPKPPVNVELEHAKEIVSTISVAAKATNSASTSEVPHKEDSGVKSDYRLLNLGMKLPEDFTSEEGVNF